MAPARGDLRCARARRLATRRGSRALALRVRRAVARRRRVLVVRPCGAGDGRRARVAGRRGAAPAFDRGAARGDRRRLEAAPLSHSGRAASLARDGTRPAGVVARAEHRTRGRVPARGARGRDRARARARSAPRRRAPDGCRRARRVDHRAEPHRRLVPARRCSSCSVRSPPPACTCSSRRSASSRPTAQRPRSALAARSRGRTAPPRAGRRARRRSARAPRPSRSTRSTRSWRKASPRSSSRTRRSAERVRRLRDLDPSWREKLRTEAA